MPLTSSMEDYLEAVLIVAKKQIESCKQKSIDEIKKVPQILRG